MVSEKTAYQIMGIIFSIVLLIVALIVIRPLVFAILWGIVLAYIFYPLYAKINKIIKNRSLSAAFIILIVLVVIFLATWFFIPKIAMQVFNIYSYIQGIDWTAHVGKLFPSLSEQISRDFASAIDNFLAKLAKSSLEGIGNLVFELPNISLHIFIAAVIFFFTLRDADKLKEYIKSLSPFSKLTEKQFFQKFKDMTYSVIYGQFIIGLVQGIVTGIGLLVFGVPQTLILTILAIFFSILPIIGPMIIWLPASVYLIITGHVGAGIGLFIYGTIVISWIDNITRSIIISRKVLMHPALVWVGMIGGLIAFGILGLIIGPLVLEYLLILVDFYKQGKFKELFSRES